MPPHVGNAALTNTRLHWPPVPSGILTLSGTPAQVSLRERGAGEQLYRMLCVASPVSCAGEQSSPHQTWQPERYVPRPTGSTSAEEHGHTWATEDVSNKATVTRCNLGARESLPDASNRRRRPVSQKPDSGTDEGFSNVTQTVTHFPFVVGEQIRKRWRKRRRRHRRIRRLR